MFADISRLKSRWVLEVDRRVALGCCCSRQEVGVPFPCSVGLCETGSPPVCPAVLRRGGDHNRVNNMISFFAKVHERILHLASRWASPVNG